MQHDCMTTTTSLDQIMSTQQRHEHGTATGLLHLLGHGGKAARLAPRVINLGRDCHPCNPKDDHGIGDVAGSYPNCHAVEINE